MNDRVSLAFVCKQLKSYGVAQKWLDMLKEEVRKNENVGEMEWTFGKHKGKKLKDVPSHYLRWYMSLENPMNPTLYEKLDRYMKMYFPDQVTEEAMTLQRKRNAEYKEKENCKVAKVEETSDQ